ncbi:MAG: LapA family protein [Rhodospirillaceae bacterium]|nr:LapA family protein [Rhodospirillaceae bacterium]
MRLLTWLIGVAVAVVTVLFAISNRSPVSISVWPFPVAVDVSLYILILAAVFSGFLVGAFVTWVKAGKHRRRVRQQRTEIRTLEGELSDVHARLASKTKSD